MSDPVSALKGARHAGLVEVRETGLGGMVTLRGDFASFSFQAAVKSVTGAEVPATRKIAMSEQGGVAWMSPDELLLLVDYAQADAVVAKLDEALAGEHFMAANVSDARACFSVSGESAREVMGKLAPVDFSSDKFGAGDFRRSRLAQVAAAFWMDDVGAFHIVCFRSVGQYMFDLLKVASHPQSTVGVY
jgi:sarcosine oxidase subunit gamma